MYIVYDLIYIFLLIFYFTPYFFIKRKYHKGFIQRLGIFSKNLRREFKKYNNIWIHSVSVGETILACKLAKSIKATGKFKVYNKIIISVTTVTGFQIAKDKSDSDNIVIYFPLDLSFIVTKVIRLISPKLIILIETELWPAIIKQAHKKSVPVIIVNGRISDKSYNGYRLISKIFRNVLKSVELFCMQSELDAKKIISLGVYKYKVKVCGNMKFDVYDVQPNETKLNNLRHWLNYNKGDNVFVCGSTHPGEDEMIMYTYKRLLEKDHKLKLVIVPRHPERWRYIKEMIKKQGFYYSLFSEDNNKILKPNLNLVYIMDQIGWLNSLYYICDIAFVGGSLKKYGGHNIIEPALFSKPIIFGSYMSNFKFIVKQFLDKEAALVVKDKIQLFKKCDILLKDKNLQLQLGKKAYNVVKSNRGATNRILNYIKNYLN